MNNAFVRELSGEDIELIEPLFFSVFSREPWNDDWSDKVQLRNYLLDIAGNRNSLSFGLFIGDGLIGLSLGSVFHWWSGTEYYIREFCISQELQNKGYGSFFLRAIEEKTGEKNIGTLLLSTERETAAFGFYGTNGFKVLDKTVFLAKNL